MVKQVILFGSKTRGDDNEESDIDLFLLTTRPMDWRERESMLDDFSVAQNILLLYN